MVHQTRTARASDTCFGYSASPARIGSIMENRFLARSTTQQSCEVHQSETALAGVQRILGTPHRREWQTVRSREASAEWSHAGQTIEGTSGIGANHALGGGSQRRE